MCYGALLRLNYIKVEETRAGDILIDFVCPRKSLIHLPEAGIEPARTVKYEGF